MSPFRCLIFVCLFLSFNAFGFRVVHYNILELDAVKLLEGPQKNEQVNAAMRTLDYLNGDIYSINELQYDVPGAPDSRILTEGQTIVQIAEYIGRPNYESIFYPANTGQEAEKDEKGEYARDKNHPKWLELADERNFGLFPHQYSSGGLSQYPVLEVVNVIDDLLMKEAIRDLDLSKNRDAKGKPYDVDVLELFDKNLTHSVLKVEGKKLHLILLHTVPAFDFGNDKGINNYRNRVQLEFLEWYLTGKAHKDSIDVDRLEEMGIVPMKGDESFVAMGDWNIKITEDRAGAFVLRRLGEKFNYATDDNAITYEGRGFREKSSFAGKLDYILFSDDLELKGSGVFGSNKDWSFKTCKKSDVKDIEVEKGKKLIEFRGRDKKTCWATVSREYYLAKKGSDHLAVWADLEFK